MNRTVLALGMFDGVHIGHRALLARAAALAGEAGDKAAAFTYTNHPKELFSGAFAYLTTFSQKAALCRAAGVDAVDAVPFTRSFADLSPEAFLAWLSDRYEGSISAIVCGYDFRFGKGAEGDGAALKALGTRYGFSTEILPPVLYEGVPCSSSRVRDALTRGDLAAANAMLNRPYAITGTVCHNRAIGRTLGFPTANVDPGAMLLPGDGVYASALVHAGRPYAAVTNVGCNPTVGGERRTLETYVPDETLSLYGERVTVLLLRRLRGEVRFASRDALGAQIGRDAAEAKKVFKETEKSVYNARAVW